MSEHELIQEARRLNYDLSIVLWRNSVAMEAPLRTHSREIDGGGAPELHNEFLRWLGAICKCGRPRQCDPNCKATRFDEHLPSCEPACRDDPRFHASSHAQSPTRLRRALRQVRKLNPHAYDLLYMLVGLRMSFDDATAKLNADNVSRGKPVRSEAEFAVLYVSGASMLASSF